MAFFDQLYQCKMVIIIPLIALCFSRIQAATTGLLPEGTQCVCVDDVLTYNCTITGGGTTLWRGTAFNCPTDGSVITLRHSQFASYQAFGICNNGDIMGRGLGVVNNCYTSQLNVTARESFNNKTVQCVFTSNEGTRTIGQSLLRIVSAMNRLPPPNNIYLADVQPGNLIFYWTTVAPNCSTLYNITFDCGTCPIVTNMTTVTCSDLQLTTNAVSCNFRVSSATCDLVGNPSSPVPVILKVPNVPRVEIVPSYSNNTQTLEKLFIITTMNQTEDLFHISDNISGSPTSYTAHASDLINGSYFKSIISFSSCEEASGCPITDKLLSSYCPQSNNISVTISATNKLGEGPRSNPFLIECTNDFVQVVHKETTSESTISCLFLNQSDTSEKLCCIRYRPCDQEGSENTQNCNKDSLYNIKLELSGNSRQSYCYTVTASNDTYTVKVEGNFIAGFDHRESNNTSAVVMAIIIPCICVTLLLLGIVVIFIVVVKVKQKSKSIEENDKHQQNVYQTDPLKQYLKPISLSNQSLKLHQVEKDCELREYITTTLDAEFKRGHTYYQFTNEIENIQKGKKVLLQDMQNTEEWFGFKVQPEVLTREGLQLYGEGIPRKHFGERYTVFIQSFGSGARHLSGGSSLLYNHDNDQVQPDALELVPVCSEHFAHMVIDKKCTVQEFCEQHKLNPMSFNVFLDLKHVPEERRGESSRDVILMDKESSDLGLFTGPFARQMFQSALNETEHQYENKKWKVFVLLAQNKKGFILNKDAEVLYQDSRYLNGTYTVVEVDRDCVRMSKFIEEKLIDKCKFENGKAFYEATESEEDLLYCKKILRPAKKALTNSRQELKLQSRIEYFYAISGTPTKALKPKDLKLLHSKVFIQSMSQGSRCLKAGAKLLYLKEYINPEDVQTEDLNQADETNKVDTDSNAASDSGSNCHRNFKRGKQTK